MNDIKQIFGIPWDEALKVAERNKAKAPVTMTIHKCQSCGSSVQKGQNFCSDCGQRLNWSK